jgi:hypothetical protein
VIESDGFKLPPELEGTVTISSTPSNVNLCPAPCAKRGLVETNVMIINKMNNLCPGLKSNFVFIMSVLFINNY